MKLENQDIELAEHGDYGKDPNHEHTRKLNKELKLDNQTKRAQDLKKNLDNIEAKKNQLKSKFNYVLKGEWNPNERQAYDAMIASLPKDANGNVQNVFTEEGVGAHRETMKAMFANFAQQAKPLIDMCETEVVSYNPREYGSDHDGPLEIHVHRVKGKAAEKNRRALIYFHSGGGVA